MQFERHDNGLTIEIGSEEEMERLGHGLAGLVTPGVVIGLIGPLGAGKTRLSRALAEALGVDPLAIASPTFVLIHEYEGAIPVYHFDAYRLPSADEFEALGAADYFGGEGVCLVEWADLVLDRLPREAWLLRIEPTGPEQRRVEARFPFHSPVAEALAQRLTAV